MHPVQMVLLERSSFDTLRAHIEVGEPVLTLVATDFLPYWTRSAFHAVVVVGMDDENVYLHDPLHPPPARAVPHADFLHAWGALFHSAALLRRRLTGTKSG